MKTEGLENLLSASGQGSYLAAESGAYLGSRSTKALVIETIEASSPGIYLMDLAEAFDIDFPLTADEQEEVMRDTGEDRNEAEIQRAAYETASHAWSEFKIQFRDATGLPVPLVSYLAQVETSSSKGVVSRTLAAVPCSVEVSFPSYDLTLRRLTQLLQRVPRFMENAQPVVNDLVLLHTRFRLGEDWEKELEDLLERSAEYENENLVAVWAATALDCYTDGKPRAFSPIISEGLGADAIPYGEAELGFVVSELRTPEHGHEQFPDGTRRPVLGWTLNTPSQDSSR